jgi:hypothetical protein
MTNEDPQLPQFSLTIRQRVWRLRIICLSTKLPGVREHLVRVYREALVVLACSYYTKPIFLV